MGEKGKALLMAIGLKPKRGVGGDDEPDGDEGGDEEGYEPNDGELAAAEDLCRALDIDEAKAPDVAKAICAIGENHKNH